LECYICFVVFPAMLHSSKISGARDHAIEHAQLPHYSVRLAATCCLLPAVSFLMFAVCCLLSAPAVCCPQESYLLYAYAVLSTVCCLLSTVCWLLVAGQKIMYTNWMYMWSVSFTSRSFMVKILLSARAVCWLPVYCFNLYARTGS
jgi:hypothetical protein